MNKYETLIETGIQLNDEYKFQEAFDIFKEAKELDKNNPSAYIEAAKTCHLTKQFNSAVALHVVGVLLLSKKPHNPSTIATHYYENGKHVANALLLIDESLQTQMLDYLEINKDQLKLAMDAYKYSLLETAGKSYYMQYTEELTMKIYSKYQDTLSNIGIHYINSLINNNLTKEHIIKRFLENINWQ